jgi:hypothetical protein
LSATADKSAPDGLPDLLFVRLLIELDHRVACIRLSQPMYVM